ncbi:MAG: hypothetical protein CL424_08690 [Acidimicrobiaceae bacterium]|nr:hypothetical protein [Acidimicrobiaceae bacterium]
MWRGSDIDGLEQSGPHWEWGFLMYLFTRTVTLVGTLPKAVAYAVDIRGYVTEKLGRDVGLWSANFGAPHGTMVFSARVDGLADLADMNATLMSDQKYHDRLEAGADFRGVWRRRRRQRTVTCRTRSPGGSRSPSTPARSAVSR